MRRHKKDLDGATLKVGRIIKRPAGRKAGLLAVVVMAGCSIAIAVRAYTGRSPASLPVAVLEDSNADISAVKVVTARARPTAQGVARRTIETVTVRLRADGFSPTEVTQPRGAFFLMVENETALEELALRLDLETGSQILQVDVPRKKRDWAEALDLPAGRYLLTEANHPGWSCSIRITNE